jgi:hypothetical protein
MQHAARLLLPLLLLGAACDDDDPSSPDGAALRFLHASPDVAAVSLRADGAVLVASAAYGAAPNGYASIDGGEHDLAVRLVGGTTDLATAELDADAGERWTAVLSGEGDEADLLLLEDDDSAPSAGQARIRVLNAAPSATSVDVYVTAAGTDLSTVNPNASAVTPEDATAYLGVPVGSYRVRITAAGSKTTILLDVQNVALTAGKVRTLVVLDDADGGAPLRHALLADRE